MSSIIGQIKSEKPELFALEFGKIAESDFVYTPASTNIDYPQLSRGIEIAQLSHYSRGTTPQLCLPVCRGLRPVSPDDGILVVE